MSIKVAVRVRPFNAREKERDAKLVVQMSGQSTIVKDPDNDSEKTFTFDYSFWSHDCFEINNNGYCLPVNDKYADQQAVYSKLGEEILNNAWDGYNCCLFAYGQTGSGKSYSMIGYGQNKGIVPIACNEIFTRINDIKSKSGDTSFEVLVSMLEIYNEKTQDLLIDSSMRPTSGLKIRESKLFGPYVENLTKYPVTSYEEIANKMTEGNDNRTIGSTLMNATSSRAHTIITIEFKQIQQIQGKTTEKVSIINLVDLAGSERSSSTGATGSRLKEGCNINKSLLALGNVINVLADKSLGKGKNILPPYRDSSLTRILQNALGGNSKTVMICAISPADINYEETVSTLRYADRAKKIQNKAVINESQSDKLIRMLREENLELKIKLDKLLGSINLGSEGKLSNANSQEILDLKEEYESNLTLMSQMEKTFEDKLNEVKQKETKGGIKSSNIDTSKPYLVVLNEDPQLSQILKYSLSSDKLPLYVGRKTGSPKPNIILSGAGIKVNHALFEILNNNEVILKSSDQSTNSNTFVNGKQITHQGIILSNQDIITFGSNTHMIYVSSSQSEILVDWETANDLFEKERENEEVKVEEDKERKKEQEISLLKQNMEEVFLKEKTLIEDKLRKQLEEYEIKLKNMNNNDEIQKIYKSKNYIENILKDDEIITNIQKRLQLKLLNQSNDESEHISMKFELTLITLAKKLVKFRDIIKKIRRNYHIDMFLNRDIEYHIIDNIKNNEAVMFKVENYEEGEVYYWTSENFTNRLSLIEELYEANQEEFSNGKDITVPANEDGLYDKKRRILMGYSFVSLRSIFYLINMNITTPVFSAYNSLCNAKLKMSIKVSNSENNQMFSLSGKEPIFEEYKNKRLKIDIIIESLIDMDSSYYGDVLIEFCSNIGQNNKITCPGLDDVIVNNQVNINYTYSQIYTIQSKEDLNYLEEETLIIKVFAIEQTKKIGKMPLPKKLIYTEESRENRSATTYSKPSTIVPKKKDSSSCVVY